MIFWLLGKVPEGTSEHCQGALGQGGPFLTLKGKKWYRR